MSSGIVGTGSYLPSRVTTNDDLVRGGLDTSDDWIARHTGIRERRIAGLEEATSDLAVLAARRALDSAGLGPRDVDLIICATSTPDHPVPATASLVQHRLGCKAGAFDLNAACSGFVHALCVGFAVREAFGLRHVLVIGADVYSRLVDWSDRRSAVFFGDGAGAAIVGESPGPSWLLSSSHGSDGSGAKHIIVPAGGSRPPVTPGQDRQTTLRMSGRDVWSFALERVPGLIREVVGQARLTLADVSLVVAHQANARLLEACAERLSLPSNRMFMNVERYGNTAAASVAIALDEARRAARIQAGDHVVLVGFGGGLAWSAACLRWGETDDGSGGSGHGPAASG